MSNYTEVRIPIKGRLLVQFDNDHDRVQHIVATFEHYIPVRIEAPSEDDATPVIKLNEKWGVNPIE